MKNSGRISKYIRTIYLISTFVILDAWLRIMTRWIGWYSIYELAPNLFTLVWSVFIVSWILLLPTKIAKIIYAITYYIGMFYAVIQYGYYLIFGKFLYLSDFLFAGEGADYTGYIIEIINLKFVICIFVLLLLGAVGIKIFPKSPANECKKRLFQQVIIIVIFVSAIFGIPELYKNNPDEIEEDWGNFADPVWEYDNFTNSGFDVELTGIYQFVARDAYLRLQGLTVDYSDVYEELNAWFEKKEEHNDNEMTGVFAGKNIIVVMIESIDDWLITEQDMPTLWKLKNEGINFTNMYTPAYANGYTFNTEFAFNTGVYPLTNGNVAYSLTRNDFSYSLPSLFSKEGYSVNSFHENYADFYNRGTMHEVLGYERYHSFHDYSDVKSSVEDDTFLYKSDSLYAELTAEAPFMSFVITVSGHLPYDEDDEISKIALEKYPQYAEGGVTEERVLRAKARLTDDMFSGLLERLESDGILENTVIVAFADHYAYGMTDSKRLQQLSEEAGNTILENTPVIIYCAGYEGMTVDKYMQTTDLSPTIANLFGLNVPKEIMGSDVFDPAYGGHVIFPNNTWLTEDAYVKNGSLLWNNGMTDDEIREMNEYVSKAYEINDNILKSDYYSRLNK